MGKATTFRAFWSYVHVDDKAERGRIATLARDVVEHYAMSTGDQLDLFLDKDKIKWGEGWRMKIDESLSGVAFFVPVLTTRYFLSSECRRELEYFIRKSSALGIAELIPPPVL